MLKYQVVRPILWNGKKFQKNEIIFPRNKDQAWRCKLLCEDGRLSPILGDELLEKTSAAGVETVFPRPIRQLSEAFDKAKQKEKKDE